MAGPSTAAMRTPSCTYTGEREKGRAKRSVGDEKVGMSPVAISE